MSRPPLSHDSPSKRVQLVITADEVAALDDWMFANRVSTRSEAIRRLCKLGMESGRARTSSEMLSIAINQPSPYSREDLNCMNTRLGDQFLKV